MSVLNLTSLLKSILLMILLTSIQALAQLSNPMQLGSMTPTRGAGDGAVARGFIVPSTVEIKDGFRINVEIYHQSQSSPVSLYLQMVVNDGNGGVTTIPFLQLDSKVADNPTSYRSLRSFDLSYSKLNEILVANNQGGHQLRIGPGSPLFVYAFWDATSHQWGGYERSGIIYTPGIASNTGPAVAKAIVTRPKELDLAYPITTLLTNLYNSGDNGSVGLLLNGQIRSRVEGEGKFQIIPNQHQNVLREAFKLARDPSLARQVLGNEWTIKVEDRYMKRDASGNLILNSAGLPEPDPMVDTYYDNKNFDAAKNDVALRYRWTEGNASGAWNFKPGMGESSAEGLVYRTEYAVDATNDQPQTIQKFANSDHPLNFFRSLRRLSRGSVPSDYFIPSVKVIDHRYKFKLEHISGLAIEMSIDGVEAQALRKNKAGAIPAPVRYVQIEMDIDHLATKSSNVVGNKVVNSGQVYSEFSDVAAGLKKLSSYGPNYFIDGTPVMHDESDLKATSALRQARQGEFDTAQQVIVSLRKHLVGNEWLPGAQKYAFSVSALSLVQSSEASNSVRSLLRKVKMSEMTQKPFTGARSCAAAFR